MYAMPILMHLIVINVQPVSSSNISAILSPAPNSVFVTDAVYVCKLTTRPEKEE